MPENACEARVGRRLAIPPARSRGVDVRLTGLRRCSCSSRTGSGASARSWSRWLRRSSCSWSWEWSAAVA